MGNCWSSKQPILSEDVETILIQETTDFIPTPLLL